MIDSIYRGVGAESERSIRQSRECYAAFFARCNRRQNLVLPRKAVFITEVIPAVSWFMHVKFHGQIVLGLVLWRRFSCRLKLQ